MKKLFCILIVGLTLLSGCHRAEPVVGSAPDFTVQNAAGEEVSLSDYFGKPIVLNLWATWCPPCKEELPHFQQAYEQYEQVTFLMVNLTVSDSKEAVQQLMEQTGYSFPVFYDTTGGAAAAYEARAIPMTVFISRRGEVVNQKLGMLSAEELQENIRGILQ